MNRRSSNTDNKDRYSIKLIIWNVIKCCDNSQKWTETWWSGEGLEQVGSIYLNT